MMVAWAVDLDKAVQVAPGLGESRQKHRQSRGWRSFWKGAQVPAQSFCLETLSVAAGSSCHATCSGSYLSLSLIHLPRGTSAFIPESEARKCYLLQPSMHQAYERTMLENRKDACFRPK